VEIRPLGDGDVEAVQGLVESDPGYAERITGSPPGAGVAQELLTMRPPRLAAEAKVVLGVFEGDESAAGDGGGGRSVAGEESLAADSDRSAAAGAELVAVVDLLRGYPDDSVAFVGLLQVRGGRQGLGIGRTAYRLVEEYVIAQWPEVRRLRLAVVDTNADLAGPFWDRLGFEATGEVKAYENDAVSSTARLYEKALCWAHPHLVVRESSIAGKGLFATAPIAAGEVVSVLAGRKVSTAELAELLKRPPVDTITLEEDLHLVLPNDPRPVIAYGNHSCDPNTWWTDAVTLVARRDFAAADELTSDYGTSTGVPEWRMSCACGSALCRGVVTGADWQRPELQERYGDHWIPELLARQNRQ
jgi:ribosomal protein S18 acetylase RimI-like enzyme